MLQQKLDRDDRNLAFILSDPILCMEFLRSTKDGTDDQSLWDNFKYRSYQKDILTDQNPYVSVTGGRSIGKCQVAGDRIYTEFGYQYIKDIKYKHFRTWAWDYNTDTYTLRRAICVDNGMRKTYTLITNEGKITVTGEHPVWTDTGWKLAKDIQIGDYVTKITKLPHSFSTEYDEYEMRFIGYTLFNYWRQKTAYNDFTMRSAAVQTDFDLCLQNMGVIKPWVKGNKHRHPVTTLQHELGLMDIRMYGWKLPRRPLPKKVMQFCEKNLFHLLSAVLSQYAKITTQEISFIAPNARVAEQMQELFLRFGVELQKRDCENTEYTGNGKRFVELYTYSYLDVYTILKTFDLRGFRIGNIREPLKSEKSYRYSKIENITSRYLETYAIQVEKDGTYITEDMLVHNSYILEDMILWDVLNNRKNLEKNGELILSTANQAQITPVLDRIIIRFLSSPILRGYVSGGLNKQKGVVDWSVDGKNVRMYARIVGSNTESNLIGLHVNRIRIDEGQVYRIAAYRQLQPTLNTWFKNIQMFMAGVPNSITNSALYYADQRSPIFKKYRIPATNNPFFTEQDFLQALKDYGGEDTDLFQNLVLGKWGKGSEQVISQEDIAKHDEDFYTFRYTAEEKMKGVTYQEKCKLIDYDSYDLLYCGIDTGFVDPTIIQIFGLKHGRWHAIVRYRLQRIDYPMQEQIIDYLHSHYKFTNITFDLGSGGNAPAIVQSLLSRPEYKQKRYESIIHGVLFQEHIIVGYNVDGSEIKQDLKTVAAKELVNILQNKQLLLSSIDVEGLSEMERIARQTGMNGQDKYFILSEGGKGKAANDHIFSAFLCFAYSVRDMSYIKARKKKLGKTIG